MFSKRTIRRSLASIGAASLLLGGVAAPAQAQEYSEDTQRAMEIQQAMSSQFESLPQGVRDAIMMSAAPVFLGVMSSEYLIKPMLSNTP